MNTTAVTWSRTCLHQHFSRLSSSLLHLLMKMHAVSACVPALPRPRSVHFPSVMRVPMLALMSADMQDDSCVLCCAGAFTSGAGQQGAAVPGSSKPRFADSKGLGKSMSKALAQADAGEGPLSAHYT